MKLEEYLGKLRAAASDPPRLGRIRQLQRGPRTRQTSLSLQRANEVRLRELEQDARKAVQP